jgi:hypothetical protein
MQRRGIFMSQILTVCIKREREIKINLYIIIFFVLKLLLLTSPLYVCYADNLNKKSFYVRNVFVIAESKDYLPTVDNSVGDSSGKATAEAAIILAELKLTQFFYDSIYEYSPYTILPDSNCYNEILQDQEMLKMAEENELTKPNNARKLGLKCKASNVLTCTIMGDSTATFRLLDTKSGLIVAEKNYEIYELTDIDDAVKNFFEICKSKTTFTSNPLNSVGERAISAVKIRHILINTRGLSVKEKEQVYKKINTIKEMLNNGSDFSELAKKYSDGPMSNEGGDLNYIGRGILPVELENFAFASDPGEISPIIKTQWGYHIIKVIDKK